MNSICCGSSEGRGASLRPVGDLPAMQDVKGKTIRGGAATVVGQFGRLGLQTVSTMVLARLLTPTDFGLIAMVTAVTGFINLLKDAGLSAATVQKDAITHGQVSSLFWINVILGLLLSGITVALAPLIADFYQEPRLKLITCALAINFVLGAMLVQHDALMRREMRFMALAWIEVISTLGGIIAAILLALLGCHYWALVGMSVVRTILNVLALWTVQSWRPGIYQRGSGVRPMLRFGGYLTFNSLLNFGFRNLDNVLIGWCWGAGPLGFYTKAYGLLMLPINQVNSPIRAVAVSALSRVQKDEHRMRRYFVGGYSIITSITLPIIVSTVIFADEIILLMLGKQWLGAVDLFRYLAPAALVGVLSNPLGWVLWATGRADRLLQLGFFWTGMVVIGFVVGLQFGAKGVAIGFSAASCALALPNCLLMIKGTCITLRDIWEAMKHPLVAVLFAGAAGLGFKLSVRASTTWTVEFCVGGLLVACVYILTLLVFMGKWPFFRDLIREFRQTKAKSTTVK